MPYFYYREIRTPLKLLGIRIMKDDRGKIWFKVGKKPRKMLNKSRSESNKSISEKNMPVHFDNTNVIQTDRI